MPNIEPVVTLEDVEENTKSNLALSVRWIICSRSFYTYYRFVVAYNYKSTERMQQNCIWM